MTKHINYITALFLFLSLQSFAQPQLVKDIVSGAGAGVESFNVPSRVWNNKLYFVANDGVSGSELWVSDGTAAGTFQVKDMSPGAGSANIGAFFAGFQDKVYFNGESEVGYELWASDGTLDGTGVFRDACPGACDGPSYDLYNNEFAEYHNRLYFMSESSANGTEVWSTDGTPAGTSMLADLNSMGFGSSPIGFVVFQDKLYFGVDGFTTGFQLWATDGTTAGTAAVKTFNGSTRLRAMAATNDYLFFYASNAVDGAELWRSDGTAAGTVMVKDIFPGANGSLVDLGDQDFIVFKNKYYFIANNGTNGREIWSSDGSEAGTALLVDVSQGGGNSLARFLGVMNGKLYFSAYGAAGEELWATDGTTGNTAIVKDIFPGFLGSNIGSDAAIHNGRIFFGASDGANGKELWMSDGTAAGTNMLADLKPQGSSSPSNFHVINQNTLLFFAETTDTGRELWKLDISSPTAEMTVSLDSVCTQDTVVFASIVNNPAGTTYQWTFGIGAQPSTATGVGPHNVKYTSSGTKQIRLVASTTFGKDTALQSVVVRLNPLANFTANILNQTVAFNNFSTNATMYLWDFGDGNNSTEFAPMHHYDAPGSYTVKLTAGNQCQDAQKTLNISTTVGIDELENDWKALVAPNPSHGRFYVTFENLPGSQPVRCALYNLQGQLINTQNVQASQVGFEEIPAGAYVLRLTVGSAQQQVLVTVH
ncbi:MAG: PKD domain-containing protein [Saprospiraceae bacterium]|nr:PKD domain-containing protein [Saprospiraceae bacterium]